MSHCQKSAMVVYIVAVCVCMCVCVSHCQKSAMVVYIVAVCVCACVRACVNWTIYQALTPPPSARSRPVCATRGP